MCFAHMYNTTYANKVVVYVLGQKLKHLHKPKFLYDSLQCITNYVTELFVLVLQQITK